MMASYPEGFERVAQALAGAGHGLLDAQAVASPCINVCRMDEATGWCEGCLRTLDEIARWSALGEENRRRLCSELEQRGVEWRRLGGAQAAKREPR